MSQLAASNAITIAPVGLMRTEKLATQVPKSSQRIEPVFMLRARAAAAIQTNNAVSARLIVMRVPLFYARQGRPRQQKAAS